MRWVRLKSRPGCWLSPSWSNQFGDVVTLIRKPTSLGIAKAAALKLDFGVLKKGNNQCVVRCRILCQHSPDVKPFFFTNFLY
jgi:hypothetical protein